jgi:hypothetical protein
MVTGDFEKAGIEDLHQLQRAWEQQHRILTGESVGAAHALQEGNALARLLLSRRPS